MATSKRPAKVAAKQRSPRKATADASETPARGTAAETATTRKASTRKASTRKAAAKSSPASAPARSSRPSGARDAARQESPEAKLAEYHRKRDFSRTAEPRGGARSAMRALAFVIQKHAATRLHFDLRLELDGVMKSWAVPKGPSVEPGVRRLAMEVEDHPIEYNTFEGTIPKGEYGGGTVMLWDRGVYGYAGEGDDDLQGLRDGYRRGELRFVVLGERLRGSWVLVRTNTDDRGRGQWLLIKQRDEFAEPGRDVVAEHVTSVATGRTMEEIASGARAAGRSKRGSDRAR